MTMMTTKMTANELRAYVEDKEDQLIHMSEVVREAVEIDVEDALQDHVYDVVNKVVGTIQDSLWDTYIGYVEVLNGTPKIPEAMLDRLVDKFTTHIDNGVTVEFNIDCDPFDIIESFFEAEIDDLTPKVDPYIEQMETFLNQ